MLCCCVAVLLLFSMFYCTGTLVCFQDNDTDLLISIFMTWLQWRHESYSVLEGYPVSATFHVNFSQDHFLDKKNESVARYKKTWR